MKKIILRRLELLLNGDKTKEEAVENILELVEEYSKRFIIFADTPENANIEDLDELHSKFSEYWGKNTDISGNFGEKT